MSKHSYSPFALPLAVSVVALAACSGSPSSEARPIPDSGAHGGDALLPGDDAGSVGLDATTSLPSSPDGATSSDGSLDAPDGVSSPSDAAIPAEDAAVPPVPAADSGLPASGYLHTQGANVVDGSGKTVRLTGVSWFGLETSNYAPHGLWSRSLDSMLDQIASLGFNSLRIPFCSQMLDAGSTPNGIDFSQNPALTGKTALEILDAVVAGAKARGLRVVLDRHRPDSGAQSALWYTSAYSEDRWINDWKMLAAHYKGDPTVVGFDLHNEPHAQATWGSGATATDWRLAAERAGNAILTVNPELLIIVEGVETTAGGSYWWGGNLKSAKSAPVRLAVDHQLVYSIHDYPASVFAQPWFGVADYPGNLPGVWDATWGYLVKDGTAPIWVGEFGSKLDTTVDRQWMQTLIQYVADNGLGFAFWSWNPDSGDTGGLLGDDWKTVNDAKMAIVKAALAPKI